MSKMWTPWSSFRQCPRCGSFEVYRHRGQPPFTRFVLQLYSCRRFSYRNCNSLYYGYLLSRRKGGGINRGVDRETALPADGNRSDDYLRVGISVCCEVRSFVPNLRVGPGKNFLDYGEEFFQFDRLRHVAVHCRLARQRSLSPFMASAVSAIIGKCAPLFFSFSRMHFDASNPSITGICPSIRTMSKGCFSRAPSASRPFCASTTMCPLFFKKPGNESLIYFIVFRHKKSERFRLLPNRVPSHETSSFMSYLALRQKRSRTSPVPIGQTVSSGKQRHQVSRTGPRPRVCRRR